MRVCAAVRTYVRTCDQIGTRIISDPRSIRFLRYDVFITKQAVPLRTALVDYQRVEGGGVVEHGRCAYVPALLSERDYSFLTV